MSSVLVTGACTARRSRIDHGVNCSPVRSWCPDDIPLTTVSPGGCNKRTPRKLRKSITFEAVNVPSNGSVISVEEVATDANRTSVISSSVAAVCNEEAEIAEPETILSDSIVDLCSSSEKKKRKRGRPRKVISTKSVIVLQKVLSYFVEYSTTK